jgi:hypothetical protein
MRKIWLGVAILVTISISPSGLVSSGFCGESEFQTWFDVTTIHKFADNWRYDGDQGIRGVLSQSDFTLFYIRPSVRYRVKPWFTVHGGIRFFKVFDIVGENTFEIGPWQGLRFTWPQLGRWAVSHYFRLEEQMIWQTTVERVFNFNLRARYQLGLRSPNYDILFNNGLYLLTSAELFWNLKETFTTNFVNRVRVVLGAGTKVTDSLRVELHYTLQDGKSVEDNIFQNPFDSEEHILRLRLFYTF